MRMAPRFMRPKTLAVALDISIPTLYRRLNDPRENFPRPVRIGLGNAVGFLESEVTDYIERQVRRARGTEQPARPSAA